MQGIDTIFYIAILIMSVVIHEVCHGFMADYWGDKTARLAGRLTLNPLKHLDMFGSILLPALLILTQAPFLVGWAKPVPYNPYNLRNFKWGTIAVASAGVLANIFIAVLFGVLVHLAPAFGIPPFDPLSVHPFYKITFQIILVNLSLAIFNLIPLAPLDGSKILFNLLPRSFSPLIALLEQYSFIFIIIFIVFFSNYLYPILAFLFNLIAGFSI